jgi:hypothetical protein
MKPRKPALAFEGTGKTADGAADGIEGLEDEMKNGSK